MYEELEEVDPNYLWEDTKHAILKETHDKVPKEQITKKVPWLSSTAINIAQNERKAKAVGDSKFFFFLFFILFAIFILHSRESELYRYTLDSKSALAWELPFSRFMGHLSST